MTKYIIIYGDLFDGIQGAVGTFDSYDQAEAYMESHNLGHYEAAIYQIDPVRENIPHGINKN